MKHLLRICIALLTVTAVMACKQKKQDDIIIIRKPAAAKQDSPQRMGDTTKETRVRWLGADYSLEISMTADPSLPLATDGTKRYYDNRVSMRIKRADGTVFFDRTFTKADFRQYVDKMYYDDGALLGIVFDKAEGSRLSFAASVGSPDKSSDEFVPLTITVSNLGAVSIEKSTVE